jgi:hypothetical protein
MMRLLHGCYNLSPFGWVAHESLLSLRQFLEDGDAHFPSGLSPNFSFHAGSSSETVLQPSRLHSLQNVELIVIQALPPCPHPICRSRVHRLTPHHYSNQTSGNSPYAAPINRVNSTLMYFTARQSNKSECSRLQRLPASATPFYNYGNSPLPQVIVNFKHPIYCPR